MKKMICIILCMVLLFGIVSPATANESMLVESVSTVKVVKPIAYTHDFDGYSNVVGVLNSDGTKTAYLFSSAEQVEQIDSLTGLISSPEEQLQRMNAAQSRAISKPTIVDAPVYSNYPTMNYNASSTMFIGGSDEAYGYGRVYIKTDVSALDNTGIAYSDIISASLNFTERQEIEDENRAATIGYDYTDYAIEASNEFSKDYTIVFYLPSDATEKLVFHMKADDGGYSYITSFTAYNYSR